MKKGAEFSECGKFRYKLWRIWDERKPIVVFIGLNPSTANADTDDPTIRRVVQIGNNLGYGGIYMMNLFAFISTDPKALKTCNDPLGDNDKWLELVMNKGMDVVFAWGNFKEAEYRARQVQAMFPKAKALFINKNGSPKHPLYCKADIKPVPFKTK